jgi:hypothetical protein
LFDEVDWGQRAKLMWNEVGKWNDLERGGILEEERCGIRNIVEILWNYF